MLAVQPQSILAIDLGTQSLRFAIFSTNAERLWTWSTPVDSTISGSVYIQDPQQWQEELLRGFDELQRTGLQPDVIVASGPLAGYTPIGSDGRSLGPAVMYLDARASEDVGVVQQIVDQVAGGHLGGFRVTIADPLPQALRLRREVPEIAAKADKLLDATGWVNHFLTGRATLNPYTTLRLYSESVMSLLKVNRSIFGDTVPVGTRIEMLRRGLADRCGLRQIPVLSAPFDSKCSYLAGGLSRQGSGLDISGTVTSVGVFQDDEVIDPQKRIYSIPFKKGFLVRGSTACAGSAVEWAKENLLELDFPSWIEAAAPVRPGADGITFLPYLAGERSPLWNPEARGALLGLALSTTKSVIARAVFESLAFSLNNVLSVMRDCGAEINGLRLSGGLARNDLICQIKSDVTGLRLQRSSDTELTTLGLIAIGSVALGCDENIDAAAFRITKVDRTFEPCAQRHREYQEPWQRYRRYSELLYPSSTANH